jgi:Adenylate and Guanylate cyclase catalytic domain
MAANEAATVETLKSYRDIITRLVVRHGGRVVNASGDALLAEFPSAVEAVQTAVEIQKAVEGHNIELEADRRMQFRIGVNLGDVIEEADGTIYGDCVNIAARMEALAEGGASVSPPLSTTPSKASFPSDSTFSAVGAWRWSSPPATPLSDKASIAVLPFDNIGGDSKWERFADGITEDISTDLSVIAG